MHSRILRSALLFAMLPVAAASNAFAGDALTIYSTGQAVAVGARGGSGASGYAVVRHERELALINGHNELRFADVAAQIDPTTVAFSSLTDPAGTRVIEQNFQFDLVSQDKLLQRFIDREISVERLVGERIETLRGVLLSTQGGIVLRQQDGSVRTVPYHAGVNLAQLPGGLITRPTLVWDIGAERAGVHKARVAYQTTGIGWWSDYNLTLDESHDCRLDIGAWVSILNQSGATYADARIKLVAGDVHRAEFRREYAAPMAAMKMARDAAEAESFTEKTFFEYHLYTLGRTSTLPENSTKQIELFPVARDVACEKSLVYYGQAGQHYGYGSVISDRNYGVGGNSKVDVYLSFRNREEQGMGVPLPAGRVRVSKLDETDGSLEFIGEDRIDHTPKNETVQLKLGSAFDVVGERRQVDFRIDSARNTMTEEIEVKLRNRKEDAVTVVVKENLYRWTNWKILSTSHDYQKQDSRTIHMPVTIAPDSEAVLRYKVRYSW